MMKRLSDLINIDEAIKEIQMTDQERYEYARNSFNNMAFWFSQVRNGIKNKLSNEIIPRTEMYPVPAELAIGSCDANFIGIDDFIKSIKSNTRFDLSKPVFIRGSLTSGKHIWDKSCYYHGDPDIFIDNIKHMLYQSWLGPEEPCTHIFLREFIKTESSFVYEKFNNMPITREVRCAVTDDKFEIYKYWPNEAFESKDDLKVKLNKMYSMLSDDNTNYLKLMSYEIHKAVKEYHADWSIDWLQDENGKWWMIDMAQLHASYINNEKGARLH